jgi:N-acetyl-alpha-D-muramate 1-phosphate uridylyltransferase
VTVPEPMLPVAILAGGLATRLRPASLRLPKALMPVGGEPFVAHQLRLLKASGFGRVVICAGYLGEQIQAFVGDGSGFGLEVAFSFDGPRLLGTGGALRRALPLLDMRNFFVLYGDSYLPCDYRAIQTAYQRCGRPALMVVFRNDGRWDRSNVEFSGGTIVQYDKRAPTPRMRHIDYGLGVLARAAVERLPADEPSDLADLYRQLLDRGELAGVEVRERFYEVGSWSGVDELGRHLCGRGVRTGSA